MFFCFVVKIFLLSIWIQRVPWEAIPYMLWRDRLAGVIGNMVVASSSINTIYTQTKKVCSETETIILITIVRSFKLVAVV